MTVISLNVATDGVNRAFTDHPVLNINAAHPGLCREGHESGMQALNVALAQVKALFGKNHNAATFRVSSASDESCAASASVFSSTPGAGKKSDA